MLKTMNDRQVKQCEKHYTKCMAEEQTEGKVIRFTDERLLDMYDLNFTLIAESDSQEELLDMIKREVLLRKEQKHSFCKIQIYFQLDSEQLAKVEQQVEIETDGFYLFDLSKFDHIRSRTDCKVIKVTNFSQLKEKLMIELEDETDPDYMAFVENKEKRKEEVYLSEGKINTYLCYDETNQVVGSCDLFIHQGIAKIEDFHIISEEQRKGYGTTLIKELMKDALEQGATKVYLVANEDETAKEMYLKLGFEKIGEQQGIFFQW
ncbi:GNAT family N-acetyltransferase [Enterococcus mundtii]|uniref:GNAT family N-acetyltransferase n=1 Tax=Enterococcus mundtii TaxID=53346 RepID=UPI003970BED2